MKTRAAILHTIGEPLEIVELEIPPLQEGQVLVQMAYSGICHSQLNEVRGLKGKDPFLPHTLGHEGSGIVVEVGKNVTKVRPGVPVVLSWLKGAGLDVPRCAYGWKGSTVNSGAISTFMNYAVISENRVIPLPSGMPLREAALLGCAIPTGAGVVRNEMQLKEGSSFALFGAGGVGLSALLAAKFAKAYPLIVVDVQEKKLKQAKELGATHVFHAKDAASEKILELTNGQGVDFAFESAGKKEAMENAFRSVKVSSGLCVLAGNLPQGEKIAIDPFDLIRGKRLIGTWGGKSHIDADVAYYSNLYLQQQFNFSSLISKEISLNEINCFPEEFDSGHCIRILVALQPKGP